MTRLSSTSTIFACVLIFGGVSLLPLGTAIAAECQPGWIKAGNACHPLCDSNPQNNPVGCVEPRVKCDGPCDHCYGGQGTFPGEIGGPAGGCRECTPGTACIGCKKIKDCVVEKPSKDVLDALKDQSTEILKNPCPPNCEIKPPAIKNFPDARKYYAPKQ